MSVISGCLIIIVSALAASVGCLVVRRFAGTESRRKHHDTGSAFFLQLGVLFSVLLAFVFSETWGEYNTASLAISGEVSALHGAAIVASTLPAPQAHAVERAILDYVQAVAREEWPAMADRHSSPAAVSDLTTLLQAVARLDVSKPQDVNNQGRVLSLLTDAHTQRETRIYQMGQGLPVALWLVLVIYTLVLVACMVMAGVETAFGHLIFAGAFTGCIVMVLVIVRMLDYPFEGALALDNSDFAKVAREVAELL
jgi:hypothetical protein